MNPIRVDALLPAAPIAGAPTVVRDGEDADLIANDGVDDAERETSRDETTLPMTPRRTEGRVLQEERNGALELREEGLR